MPAAALVARLVVALVFAAAAVAKLRDPDGARTGAGDLGVPSALVGVVARALPVVEGGIALAVVVPATARLGSAAALALLVVLTAALGRAIASGRRPRCHCFGARSAGPAGPDALVRNAALLALCLVALLG